MTIIIRTQGNREARYHSISRASRFSADNQVHTESVEHDAGTAGSAIRAPRTLILSPRLQLRQKSGCGFAKCFESFSSALLHARNKAWSRLHDVQRKSASGA